MKTISRLTLATLLLPTLVACKGGQGIEMMTQINNDGRTCIRTLYFHTDSASLVSSPDTLGNDYAHVGRDWQRRWSLTKTTETPDLDLPMTSAQYDSLRHALRQQGYEGRVEDTVLVIATRHFPTVEAMSAALPIALDRLPLAAHSTLRKRFRWFYTDYTFSETFTSCDSLFTIPITDFVTADEASYWFTGTPQLYQGQSGAGIKEALDDMEQRISRWFNANLFADIYAQIALRYDMVQEAPVSLEQFMAQRDSVMLTTDLLNEPALDVTQFVGRALSDYYHTTAYAPVLESPEVAQTIEQKYAIYAALVGFRLQYALSMPGHFIGFDAVPPLTGERLVPHDFTVSATSRVVHVWAFVATFLLLLLLLGVLAYRGGVLYFLGFKDSYLHM
ncbi:MAG: hypothetical protein IJ197_04420 [Bacteroidaceae bacterium]|nr:hypothetical protein [Bacteroidaceae bacterium]